MAPRPTPPPTATPKRPTSGGGGSFNGRGASGSWTTAAEEPAPKPTVPQASAADFRIWEERQRQQERQNQAGPILVADTPEKKAGYVLYGTDMSGMLDGQYGVMRDYIGGRQVDFQKAIEAERARIMNDYRTEPDPMIRAMLKRQVENLNARLAAAVPSIAASYDPAIQSAQSASQMALINGRQFGDQLSAAYLDAAAQNQARAGQASTALAGALGGQVAAGNTSAATQDFGQFMQAQAPIQQKAAMDYGQMLSALLQTDANSSMRQQGADQAYARNLTQQLVAQAQQEAAQREYEQVQRAREQRAQALAELAAREMQGNMSFQDQLARAMQARNEAALQAQTEKNQLLQGYRMEAIKKAADQAALNVPIPPLMNEKLPWNGPDYQVGYDPNTGKTQTVSAEYVRAYAERAYRAVMADPTIAPQERRSKFYEVLGGSIPQAAMAQVDEFAAQAFAGS